MVRRELSEQALMKSTGLVEYSLYFNLICPWPIQAGRLFHHFIYWDLGQQIYWECSKWTTDLLISTGSSTFMSNWDKYYKKNEIIILKISIDQKLSIFQKLRKKINVGSIEYLFLNFLFRTFCFWFLFFFGTFVYCVMCMWMHHQIGRGREGGRARERERERSLSFFCSFCPNPISCRQKEADRRQKIGGRLLAFQVDR